MQSWKKIHGWAQMKVPLYKVNHHKIKVLICLVAEEILKKQPAFSSSSS